MRIDDFDFRSAAILLDVDGTILDIAPTPLDVSVPQPLKRALAQLHERAHGALAFVSGRTLADLDRLFAPLQLPGVGGHGAETRVRAGEPWQTLGVRIEGGLKSRLTALAARFPGVLVEDKGYSLALHYRQAPQHADAVREAVAAACAQFPHAAIEVLNGKAVVEVKSAAFDKGVGIRTLMAQAPFRGRQPLFVGDDITDRAAFAVLPEFDGVGYSVGHELAGLAGWFPTPGDVRQWLYRTAGLQGACLP